MSASAELVLPKGKFAKHIGVSAGRVSQYIAEGKITSYSLKGEGRAAEIIVERAKAELSRTLDIGQRLGNGINTRLAPATPLPRAAPEPVAPPMLTPPPQPAAPTAGWSPAPASEDNSLEGQIKREKLRAAQLANRKAAEEEELRKGRFTDTAEARALMSTIATSMMQTFEASLSEMATAISAAFKIPQRDVLHLLRKEFPAIRARAEQQQRRRATELPDTIEAAIQVEE